MQDIINRKEIADKVFFSHITDERYKVNRITITFLTQLNFEKASVYALIPRLISKSNALYPNQKDFHNYEASLYSAKVDFDISSIGDTQKLEFSVTSIDNSFALEGEKITEETTELLLNCIFNPALVDGKFNENDVESDKKAQIEAIEAELNEKRIYALNRTFEILCEGEPCAVNKIGSVEKTKEITSSDVLNAYNNMLSSMQAEIICVGCNDFVGVFEKMTRRFKELKRCNIELCSSDFSKLREKAVEKTEKLQVNQSKMVLGFKTTSKEFPALMIMSKLYGGTTTSKLFMNVREKLSLCYYCLARFNKDKNIMLVDCGVENTNIEKAKAEILSQLEDVKKGLFSDDDINTSVLSLQNDTKTLNDSLGGLTMWYFSQIYRNDIKTPEESLTQYETVTRDDIIKAANSITLDTVYVLTGQNAAD